MGSPIDVGGQYPFITFFTPPRLSGKFLLWETSWGWSGRDRIDEGDTGRHTRD